MVIVVKLLFELIIIFIIVVCGNGVLDAFGETIAVQGIRDVLVLSHGGQETLVDSLARVSLLHDAEYTVIQMLVEVLSVGEDDRACRAGTS